jgi:hypothetical protein
MTSFLLQKVKLAVKGHHFESTEDIQRAVTQASNVCAGIRDVL